MFIFILGIIIIVLGLIIRGEYLTIVNFTTKKFEDFNKWLGINIILTGIILFFYGIMKFLGKTTLVTHIMLAVIISLLFIRIFIGPSKQKNNKQK